MRWARTAKALTVLMLSCCALANCGGPPAGPRAQREGCAVTLVADVPYSTHDGELLVPATVNGAAARLEVDTGASGALTLNRSKAVNRRLGAEFRSGPDEGLTGSGAIVRWETGVIDELRVGDAIVNRVPAHAPADPNHFLPDLPGDGVLGIDFLGNFDLEFDPIVRRLRLYRVAGCGDGVVPRFPVRGTVDMKRWPNGFASAPLRFDAVEVEALIDTGGPLTFLTPAGARKAGVSEAQLRTAPQVGAVRDVVGNDCDVCAVPFERVEFGGMEFRDIRAPVLMTSAPFEAFIGLDLLVAQPTLISFATGKIYLGQRGG